MVELELASPWQRIGAAIIDGIITIVVSFAIMAPTDFQPLHLELPDVYGLDAISDLALGFSIGAPFMAYPAVAIILVAIRGQTIGKMATRTKIVRNDAGAVGWSGALVREAVGKWGLAFLTMGMTWIISLIAILASRNCQGMHDWMGKTYVVRIPPQRTVIYTLRK